MGRVKRKQFAEGVPETQLDVDSSTSIGKLIIGLTDEIKASEKSASKFVLKDGTFSSQVGDLFIYEFPLLDEFPFQQESNLVITVGKKTGIRGYIQSIEKNSISIASEENVGTILDQITITNSEAAMLRRLKDILFDVSKNQESVPFSTRHASFVLAEGNPSSAPLSAIPKDVSLCIDRWILNVEQDRAVRVGMGGEMLLLWGPPGTGKTTTIASMLAALANSDESILLVSNTNKAVDGALKKLIPNLEKLGISEAGTCLRMGRATEDFLEGFGSKCDLVTVAAERNKDLIQEQSQLSEHRQPLAPCLDRVRAHLQEYAALEASQKDLTESNQNLQRLANDCINAEHEINRLETELHKLDTERARAPEKLGLLGALGLTRTKTEVEKEILGVLQSVSIQQSALQAAKNASLVTQDKISHLTKAIQSAWVIVAALPTKAGLRAEEEELDEKVSDIDSRLAEIERQISATEQSLIDNARIIGTTVYKAFLDQRLLKKQWDVVLIDEVSMLLLPMTYFAAGKATKRVILVGDFLQLPPIIVSDSEHVDEWVRADPFRKWGVNDPKRWEKDAPAVGVGLREQNRMHEQICNLVSRSFYKQWLVTGSHVKSRPFDGASLGKTTKRILWIETSELNAWSSKPYGKGSLFNITHAALVGEIIDFLAAKGYFQGVNSDNKKNSLGVVTPYVAQQKLIAALLKPLQAVVPGDSIGTAHKFQGDEKDTIIVDMVESSFKPSPFINAERFDDDASRLLNVALSRARGYLIIIVNKSAFEKSGSRFMWQLLNRIEAAAEKIDPMLLLRDSKYFDTAREISVGRKVAINAKNVLFTEQNFYPVITEDLFSATRSIVLFSAFMTIVGVTRWLAVLGKAMAQEAKVRIVTKTLDKQPGASGKNGERVRKELANLVKLVRRSGIAVDLRSDTHEKIIVIDERIVWNGSLNMLSQVKDLTREHMTRTDDGNYASEILNLMSRHDIRAGKTIGSEHPTCPSCDAKTYLGTGFNGAIKLKCEDECGWSVKQEYFKKVAQGIALGKIIKLCPETGCKGSLQLRYAYGQYFLGCTNYGGGCKHKEDVHVSQHLYTPFPAEQKGDLCVLSDYSWPLWEISSNCMEPAQVKAEKKMEVDVPQTVIQEQHPQEPPKKQLADSKSTRKKERIVREANDSPKPVRPTSKRDKVGKNDLDFINSLADKLLK